MNKINSFDELKSIQNKHNKLLEMRKINEELEKASEGTRCKRYLSVCGGTGCMSAQSEEILLNLQKEIQAAGLADEVKAHITGCFGFCEKGPIVKVSPDNVLYVTVKPNDAAEIVSEHLLKGKIIDRLLFEEPSSKIKIKKQGAKGRICIA